MKDFFKNDINRGYVRFVKSLSSAVSPASESRKDILRSIVSFVMKIGVRTMETLLLPVLFLYGILLILFLRLRLLFVNKNASDLHNKAITYIPEFLSQYPMHLYPIVAKTIEMSFIKRHIGEILDRTKGGTVELAVGDGTLSSRIFSSEHKVTAFDINPYSLIHTKNYRHISRRIVADCLNPPIGNNGASFIVCNNFLHHVCNKEETLSNWAKIAPFALFNENTNYWGSGWFKPYVQNLLGFKDASARTTKKIETLLLQDLWTEPQLKKIVYDHYDIMKEESFLRENVFFLCTICSALLRGWGPPTPRFQKKILVGLFWPITKIMTYHMAKALIEYDAILPRDKDSFIFWLVKSKRIEEGRLPNRVNLVCPDCSESLQGYKCMKCGTIFEEKDGMLFLLPKELAAEISYHQSVGDILGKEHL